MKKSLVLIPAYNAEQTLLKVIEGVQKVLPEPAFEILVVDDGSTDHTAELLRDGHITTLRHDRNRGKGEALKTGFQYAIENNFETVATLDADLQHDPAALPGLIECLERQNLDIVIGSRRRDPSRMSPARRASNTITSWLISLRAGTKIPDSQSGYRVIRTQLLKNIRLRTSRYETESELILKAGRLRCRFGFYPIETIYADEKSHIRHFLDTWRFVKMYFLTMNKNY